MSSRVKEFVLSALQHVGALVEDVGYGQYSVLIPPELVTSLDVSSFVSLVFDSEGEDTPEKLYLNYGHPLVENLIRHYRTQKTTSHLYVQGLRLEKQGLAELARRSFTLSKGRINTDGTNTSPHPEIFHYIRFYFRAVLLSDEKYEYVLSVLVCAQTGEVLLNNDWEYQARLHTIPDWPALTPVAPVFWRPHIQPLDPSCLSGLLQQAAVAAPAQLHETLEKLRQRTKRFLELDRARLESYYQELHQDLQYRMRRFSDNSEDEDKRRSLLDKIHHLETEKAAKLLDVEQKYAMRLQLELLTFQIVEQPKMVLPMVIEKGKKTMPATVIWDPLLHRLEPLLYDTAALDAL